MSNQPFILHKGKKIPLAEDSFVQIRYSFSGRLKSPRIGDKLLYTNNKGSLGLCIFLGIKSNKSIVVLKSDVYRTGTFPGIPVVSYLSNDNLRLFNWSDDEFSPELLKHFEYTYHP